MVAGDGGADGLVDVGRLEQGPPVAGQLLAELRLGGLNVAGHGVALRLGRRRGLEVGAHGRAAGGEGRQRRQAEEAGLAQGVYSNTGGPPPDGPFLGARIRNRIGSRKTMAMVISQKSSI